MAYCACEQPSMRMLPLAAALMPYTHNLLALIYTADIGKAEGEGKEWHGHVSAVTVAPEYRRLGLARRLMYELERISKDVYVLRAW